MSAKNRSNPRNRALIVAIAVVFVLVGVLIGNSMSGYYLYRVETDMASLPSLSTDGFIRVSVSVEPAVIYLTGECMRISMVTTLDQTTSIDLALRKMEGSRPMSHDLFANQMKVFGIDILMVKIHTLENGTYYADLIFRQDNKVLEMDSRPSDAVALAIRMDAPIYVSQELMEAEGKAAC